jgi:hypothetical protein
VQILEDAGEWRPYVLAAAQLHDVAEDYGEADATIAAVAGP